MAATSVPGMVDPTKMGKFPVILSDDLMGRGSREAFTGVRYNHRPTDEAPSTARIKASTLGSGTFDLAFRDAEGSKYGFTGRRSTDESQFVLVFDPTRKAFVLHRLDSLFNMNLVSTPTSDDAAELMKLHQHLPGQSIPIPGRDGDKNKKPGKAPGGKGANPLKAPKKKPGAAAPAQGKKPVAKKASQQSQRTQLEEEESIALPDPTKQNKTTEKSVAPATKPPRAHEDDDSDDEESDGDDGLTVEYPGGKAPTARPRADHSPAFQPRRFDEFVQGHGTEEDEDADADADADAEADFDDDVYIQPAAVAEPVHNPPSDDDIDLEAELELELQEGSGGEAGDDESDISEED